MTWPDWRGKPAAIIASGPSAKQADLTPLRGRMPVVAIKESVELCPWADAVYGCDAPWWEHRRGLPSFNGLKFAYDDRACKKYKDIRKVTIPRPIPHRMLFEQVGTVGGGGNSGFQATNLVAQFGASPIILIGFDMTDRSGVHWYGRNTWPMANNPHRALFATWAAAFKTAAKQLSERGVQVVNVSPFDNLPFPRFCTVAGALEAVLQP